MLETLDRAIGEIKETPSLQPELVAAADAAEVFARYLELERLAVAGKTLRASRATDAGQWREEGHRSPAHWLAEAAKSGLGEAQGLIETSERLQGLPETTEALRRGELSAPRSCASENVPQGPGRVSDCGAHVMR